MNIKSLLGIPDLPVDAFRPDGGRMRLYKKGGGDAPAPDPNVGKAAIEEMQLGRDWLGFAKDQFAVGNDRQAALDDLTKQVTDQQIAAQNQNMTNAQQDRTRYQTVFQPLQDQFVQTANNYDSTARQDQMAAEAKADVLQAGQQATDSNARTMASMGLNPASGRWSGIQGAQNTNTALAAAGAENNARQQVRDRALALKADAINMGSGLPSSTAASYGIGLNAGNSATGNAGAANQNWRGNVGIMSQGFGGAINGLGSGAGVLNQQYGTQVNAWSAQQQANQASAGGLMSGIGSLVGTGIGFF